jgi:hypothetical protein
MLKATIKHYIKLLLGRPDPLWEFLKFEDRIHPQTWERHDELLAWAEGCAKKAKELERPELYEKSTDPLVKQGHLLAEQAKTIFHNKCADLKDLRILVHVPSFRVSPAGYSLFNNLVQALNFIGVSARALAWEESAATALNDYHPNIFITSDYQVYLDQIDWPAMAAYRKQNKLKLGLTASLEEYGNTPLAGRLVWARQHDTDFFYTYRTPEYIKSRKEYEPFFKNNYPIISIPFGANPLSYYPVPAIEKDLDFAFLASRNRAKWQRYFEFLEPIFNKYPGLIDGPGWLKIKSFTFNQDRDRYIYARAKIGVNLHLDEQIRWAGELNERTYMLAACGVPQLIDHPKILADYFSLDGFFVAENPAEYATLFKKILDDPAEAQKRALLAQREVFERHTSFHRAEAFAKALQKML